MCSGLIQQSHVTWSCSHIQKKATFPRDTPTKASKKNRKSPGLPFQQTIPVHRAGPDLTSCCSKIPAELCKAPASASPQFQPAQPLEPGQPPRSTQCSLIPAQIPWKRLCSSLGAPEGWLIWDHPTPSLENIRDSHTRQVEMLKFTEFPEWLGWERP